MYAPQIVRPPVHRSGFSMVELMMVVVIILILMGLLLVGVNGARARVQVVAAATEISNLEKAIADFKLQYGVEPPSFIVLYEESTEWTNATPTQPAGLTATERTQLRNVSRSLIRSIWPDYSFTSDVDVNSDSDVTDFWTLNGAECLPFFLGGVFELQDLDGDGVDDFVPTGFSANPEFPFTLGGSRVGPFYTFNPARLVDVDGDVMPEYLDSLPGQETPLQYFSSYEGSGYRPWGIDGVYGNGDDELLAGGLITQYILVNSAGTGTLPTPSSPQTSWNATTFQIISPGLDGEFGLGGVYTTEGQFPSNATDLDYGAAGTRVPAQERDNITNFKGGRLN